MPTLATKDADRRYQLLALRILGEFGAAIAAPAVIAAIIGVRLDAKYASTPRWLIACLVLAFAATAAYVLRRAKAFGREYEAIGKSEKGNQRTQADPLNPLPPP